MMQMFNRQVRCALIAIVVLLALAGCGGNGTGPGTITTVKATPGSWYVYNGAEYDTNNVIISEPPTVDTVTMFGTNGPVGGVSGALLLGQTVDADSSWIRYESNGDLRVLTLEFGNQGSASETVESTIYPIASHSATEVKVDTSFDSGNFSTISHDSVVYIGDETVTVPAGTFPTSKVRDVKDHREYTSAGVQYRHVREIVTYYFAPATGFFAKVMTEHEYLDTDGHLIERELLTRLELVAYKVQ